MGLVVIPTIPTFGQSLVDLHHYFNFSNNDHFYTIDFSELGNGGGDWVYEGVSCWIYSSQIVGTVPA